MSPPDYSEAGHLPKRRPGGEAANPFDMPRQRHGTTPQMHGRHPDYDVFDQADHWDGVTRELVERRASEAAPIRFFDRREASTLKAFCDTVTSQEDEPRIPVLSMVDAKFCRGELDGFRYEDMPEDDETWKRVAAGLDQVAAREGADAFADLDPGRRGEVCRRFAAGELRGGVWDGLPCARAWSVVMRGVLSAFYSHPWAWNEIGYGGPAYPRGYMRLGPGQRDPHHAVEATDEDPVEAVRKKGLD